MYSGPFWLSYRGCHACPPLLFLDLTQKKINEDIAEMYTYVETLFNYFH